MKALILAAIRCSPMFTAVAALSIAYPTSVQAVPTKYVYTGNPFTFVTGPYSTSDFVTAMVTLAGPLGANMPLTQVTPTAFTLSDGVQTITNLNVNFAEFLFATGALGTITQWYVRVEAEYGELSKGSITSTRNVLPHGATFDESVFSSSLRNGIGINGGEPGEWTPDAGSTLSLMTLTLMALGLVARRFQRAAG